MSGFSGRKMVIKRGSTAIAGARSDSITINNEPIDVTTKTDAGWRTLLAEAGVRSVDGSIEGVMDDDSLLAVSLGAVANLLAAHTVEIDGIGSFTGDFYLNNLQIAAPMPTEITFTASLQSSGEITYTPE